MNKNKIEIEIQRNNVTLKEFFNYIKKQCIKKGIEFSLDIKEFENPSYQTNQTHYGEDDKKISIINNTKFETERNGYPCKIETIRKLQFDYQVFGKMTDGYMYNEICEFEFDEDNKGSGYYYKTE